MAQIDSKGLILVTGATGFLGRQLVPVLTRAGWQIRACGRDAARAPLGCEFQPIDFHPSGDFGRLVEGTQAVIHLAARVHVMRDSATDPLSEFRRANAHVTQRLAAAAKAAGTRQFIFASSIKVNGEATFNAAFNEDSPYAPEDAYGISKMEAEIALLALADSSFSPTVVRLPLCYGPQVGGNFHRLLRLVAAGIPLPFGSIENARSMLFSGNFAAAVARILELKATTARTYLLSDAKDLSTPDLIRGLAAALQRRARLWPVPRAVLNLAGQVTGLSGEVRRLTQSLQLNSAKIRTELNWLPPYRVSDGFEITAQAYLKGESKDSMSHGET